MLYSLKYHHPFSVFLNIFAFVFKDYHFWVIGGLGPRWGTRSSYWCTSWASMTNKYLQLLLRVPLAFPLMDDFAILIGSWITTMVPIDTLKLVSAVIFAIFGIILRRGVEQAEGKLSLGNSLVSGFSLIFVYGVGR